MQNMKKFYLDKISSKALGLPNPAKLSFLVIDSMEQCCCAHGRIECRNNHLL